MEITGSEIFLLIFKIVVIFLSLGMIGIIGQSIYKKQSIDKNPLYISLTHAFTGGAYIALALVSFLPYSQIKIQEYFLKKQQKDIEPHFLIYIPWASVLALISYVIFFAMDKLVLNKSQSCKINEQQNEIQPNDTEIQQYYQDSYINNHNKYIDTNIQGKESTILENNQNSNKKILNKNKNSHSVINSMFPNYRNQQKGSNKFSFSRRVGTQDQDQYIIDLENNIKNNINNNHHHHNITIAKRENAHSFASSVQDPDNNFITEELDESLLINHKKYYNQNHFNSFQRKQQYKAEQFFGTYLVYILFSTVEGMALGIQDKIPSLIFITTVVLLRKSAEIIKLSILLKYSFKPKSVYYQYIISYSLIFPLSIGIGWILNDLTQIFTEFLVSFLGGTFIYISCSYILIEEFQNSNYLKWVKFILLVLGIILVNLLVISEKGVENM